MPLNLRNVIMRMMNVAVWPDVRLAGGLAWLAYHINNII